METIKVKTKTKEYTLFKAKHDANGNPRYVVSWLALGLPKYEASYITRAAGLKLYRGKDFGGGFIFQSYNPQSDLEFIEASIAGKHAQ